MSIVVADDDLFEYHIYKKTKITKPGNGYYLECSRGITFEIYTDRHKKKHVILHAPKGYTVFDL
jgi:hypothetical protein